MDLKIHYENAKNLAEMDRETQTFFGRRQVPCKSIGGKISAIEPS